MTYLDIPTTTKLMVPPCKPKKPPTAINNNVMDKYIIKTTGHAKKEIDEQLARFFFATNIAFHKVENPEFIKLCNILRPGYVPPNEKTLANSLLTNVYEKEQLLYSESLKDEVVCLSIDGWTNTNNHPIICACITKDDGEVILVDTINTSGHRHDSDYLHTVTEHAIATTQAKFQCIIKSVVTDNAANMKSMRREIQNSNENIIAYGCSAHMLNLLAQDLGKQFSSIKSNVVHICKYFRNHHLSKAWYTAASGTALVTKCVGTHFAQR